MKKIGIIVQRYGLEVNGGAEYHARILAEKLTQFYEVDVITNCALSYDDWSNYYSEGVSDLNGVKVIRFKNKPKNHKKFRKYRRILTNDTKTLRFLNSFSFLQPLKKYFQPKINSKVHLEWIKSQGPYCPDLPNYVLKNQNKYHCFVFFTYLYYPTYYTMPLVANKSYFIPTAHDEPLLYTEPYKDIFSIPKGIIYNTESEKELINKKFHNSQKNNIVAGVGISNYEVNPDLIDTKYLNLDYSYFVYIGRIDGGKNCDVMITYFQEFCDSINGKFHLLLIGKNHLKFETKHKNIHFTGFVNEDTKYHLLKNSLGLIIPSKYESLSLVTLEAMLHGKIVIANKQCEVLKNHIVSSKSGFLYENQFEFNNALNKLTCLDSHQIENHKNNAIEYVKTNYNWGDILNEIKNFIK